MPQPKLRHELDFDDQMRLLGEEAQVQLDSSSMRRNLPGLAESLRPLIAGIEALGRATVQHSASLEKIESAAFAQESLPALLQSMQTNLDHRDGVTQQLFDSLYEELKAYKDQFILDILHKPIIRDLISLFDDHAELHRQIVGTIQMQEARDIDSDADLALLDNLKNFGVNLDHVSHFLLEILSRMEVERAEYSEGKWDRERHRAVAVEVADCAEDDGEIVESRKPGFIWRGRVVRHEEVVIKKWKEGYLVSLTSSQK